MIKDVKKVFTFEWIDEEMDKMKGIDFRMLRVNMFGDTDMACRTLNTALFYLKYYHERFWYEAGDREQDIDDCIANLESMIERLKAEQDTVKDLKEWEQSKRGNLTNG